MSEICSKTNQVAHSPTPIISRVEIVLLELVDIRIAGIAKKVILAKLES